MGEIKKNIKWIVPLVFSFLILIGLLIPFMFGFFKDVVGLNTPMDILICVCKHSFDLTISIYMIVIGWLFLSWYIKNFWVKPYEDIVYLLEKRNDCWLFIDRLGHVLRKENEKYISKNYYKVLRTKDIISEILEQYDGEFELILFKEAYWSRFCSLLGSYKNIFVLPFLYFFLIQAICKVVVMPFLGKFQYFCLSLFIAIFIVYDWIYKEKEKSDIRSGKYVESDNKFVTKIWVLGATIQIAASFLFVLFFVFLMVTSGNLFSMVFILFFMFTMLSSIYSTMASLYNNHNTIASYEKKHLKFVKFVLFFGAFYAILWGITHDDFGFVLAGIIICLIGFMALNRDKKKNKDKSNK